MGHVFLSEPKVILLEALPTMPRDDPRSNQRRYKFGRDQLAAEALLLDPEISQEQFCIWRRGDASSTQIWLEDLNSKNGTYVDGERVSPHTGKRGNLASGEKCALAELRDGAIIRVSNTLMMFRKNFLGNTKPDTPCFQSGSQRIVSPYGLRLIKKRAEAVRELGGDWGRTNILLEAETGSGKEMFAQFVADKIGRVPYMTFNAAQLAADRFVADLFGAMPGSYSGAPSEGKKGVMDTVGKGGALLLDEIDKVQSSSIYDQLLRFLETRDYLRLGEAQKSHKADVLVIAATSTDMERKVTRDLFERLRGHLLRLPPLRERMEDLVEVCKELLKEVPGWSARSPVEVRALEYLMLQEWPGNIRALKNTLLSMLTAAKMRDQLGLFAEDAINSAALPGPPLWWEPRLSAPGSARVYPTTWKFRSLTRERISKAVMQVKQELGKDNKSEAARRLGIDHNRLDDWLK